MEKRGGGAGFSRVAVAGSKVPFWDSGEKIFGGAGWVVITCGPVYHSSLGWKGSTDRTLGIPPPSGVGALGLSGVEICGGLVQELPLNDVIAEEAFQLEAVVITGYDLHELVVTVELNLTLESYGQGLLKTTLFFFFVPRHKNIVAIPNMVWQDVSYETLLDLGAVLVV